MNDWGSKIAACFEDESKRVYLKGVPLVLVSAALYAPPYWYWLDWERANRN